MYLREIKYEGVDWTHLAQGCDRAVGFHYKRGNEDEGRIKGGGISGQVSAKFPLYRVAY